MVTPYSFSELEKIAIYFSRWFSLVGEIQKIWKTKKTLKKKISKHPKKNGVMRESNSRPLAPKARIIPLDQSPFPSSVGDWSSGMILASGAEQGFDPCACRLRTDRSTE